MKFRALLCAALLTLACATPALATGHHHHRPASAPAENTLVEHGSYTNSDGEQVHRPAHSKSGKQPDGATARCRDGSFSFSRHHRGTCSHHGGVADWLQ